MTSSNMQEAREGATDLCFALLEHYKIHQEISHELLKNTLLSVIEKSEARGRLAGLEKMRKACEQGKRRIENFEAGFNSEGAPETPFQMHVMVTLNSIKQDFEEALDGKNCEQV